MTSELFRHRKRMALSAALVAAILTLSVTVTAYAMNSRTVLIRDDDEIITVTTTKTDSSDILRSREITLSNDDYLDLSDFRAEGDCTIRIYRAKVVFLNDDGSVTRLKAAGTVQRLLTMNGVALQERDKLNVKRTDLLENGMQIIIERAFDVAVLDYGETYSLTLTDGTVAQALELAGLSLQGDDFVAPPQDTVLEPGLTIHVSRVSYRERSKKTVIAYETKSKKSSKMDLGKSKVEQKGENGGKESLYQDKYINGVRAESVLISETVRKEPVMEIKTIGTRAAKLRAGLTPISELRPPASLRIVNGIPADYKDVIVGTAKAYSGGGVCAVGVKVKPGYIAVDPKQIPYGTQLWVVSNDGKYIYGYAIAADTGGFVKKKSCTVDLYMPNESMCIQWGHRGVTIYVLDLPRVQF
jgi:uncharacterized protein YabE (DUF348 family)/3D (Asp-Asp-Asp) domain-containing protein